MNNRLTASRMSSLLRCPRSHYWRYECGLTTEPSDALRFGSAWHAATEARWRGADYDGALAAALSTGEPLNETLTATLSGLLAGYFKHYAQEDFIKQVYPEVEFSGRIPGSRTFATAGKIDGLCVLHDGRLALKEDKTTSDDLSPDSKYWLRLRFNSQLLQYVDAAPMLGWDVSTIIYDVVRKPAIAPRQIPMLDENGAKIVVDAAGNRVLKKDGTPRESGDKEKGYTLQTRLETPTEFADRVYTDTQERPDFYFARREVPILQSDLEEFRAQRLTLTRLILHCRAASKKTSRPEQAWPRNVDERVCSSCVFEGHCLSNLTIDPVNPPAGFKVEFNPGLSK